MEPLEHSVLATTAVWELLVHSNCVVDRLSCRPAFVDEVCSRLFRSLGRICVLDVHVGQTDVPTGSPGDDPRRNLPPSLMSPGDGGVLFSLSVPLMGKSSRLSGIAGKGHSPGMDMTTATDFPRTDATPGERCMIGLTVTTVTDFPRTDATPGERCAIGLDSTTVMNVPRMSSNPG